jgi:hypothetical protein
MREEDPIKRHLIVWTNSTPASLNRLTTFSFTNDPRFIVRSLVLALRGVNVELSNPNAAIAIFIKSLTIHPGIEQEACPESQ